MKATPYELVFGQLPRSVIAPDLTVGGVVDETVIQLDDGFSNDALHSYGNGNKDDQPSMSDSDDMDDTLGSTHLVYLILYCNLIG